MTMKSFSSVFLSLLASTAAFSSQPSFGGSRSRPSSVILHSSSTTTDVLSLKLEKPLGMILEEVEEGAPKGVKVQELADSGSAYASEYRDKLTGLMVASVMGQDCQSIGFDDVMQKIIDAPSPVDIAFILEGTSSGATAPTPSFAVGTPVVIKVIQEGKPDMDLQAKVGDNLRKTLLENDVEVYRGLKKKLGNCGGGGQCTFCAVDFEASEGWEERSEYEDQKIPKFPKARLACLNNIQGPATIRTK
eukprot:CAMPEP_0194033004 /NCGR_PEP_ID=MMETSP0009_2-20130614/5825_1 /TAXON_ID=210454 /ORGANISM="Grammatophora oceanica, Strain CCMP 410" /LENGTH=246 /DNA_ID=CAMNT_0038673603 /DNA_START=20 /DNA_END=760 /DNA_ORIENTATION=+